MNYWALCFLIFIFTVASAARADRELVFGISFGGTSEVSAQVLREAYQRMGVAARIEVLPPERSLLRSNEGADDGEASRMEGLEKDYPYLVRIPVAINSFDSVIFVKDLKFKVVGWKSLRPYYICIRLGVKYAERGTQGMNVVAAQSIDQCFKMLNSGRVDLVVETRTDGLDAIKRLNLSNIRSLKPSVDRVTLYHYLNRKHSALVPRVTKELEKMASEGRIKGIQKKAYEEFLQRQKVKKPNLQPRVVKNSNSL